MSGRVGVGFDVHPFSDEEGRALVLGGTRIEWARGLAGHSDADVVAHAVADALLGAAGLGDLGTSFPDSDPRWKGADSMLMLSNVVAMVDRAGWMVVNVDCTVMAEDPRLGPHRREMEGHLSDTVSAPVSVKATSAEGLGAIGRAEGIACMAVCLLEPSATGPEAAAG